MLRPTCLSGEDEIRYEPTRKRMARNIHDMTVGVAFLGKETIVVGSDSLSHSVSDSTETRHLSRKVFPLGPKCCLLFSGQHGVGQMVAEALQETCQGEKATYECFRMLIEHTANSVVTAETPIPLDMNLWFEKWRQQESYARDVKEAVDMVQRVKASSSNNSFLLVGIDMSGKPRATLADASWRSFRPEDVPENWGIVGTQHIMRYWIYRLQMTGWDFQLSSVEDLDFLTFFLIKETATQATSVGLPVQLAHLSAAKGFEWVIPPPPNAPNEYHKRLDKLTNNYMDAMCKNLKQPDRNT